MAKQIKTPPPVVPAPAADSATAKKEGGGGGSWRAGIESACTMLLSISALLAVPVFLLGCAYRQGILKALGAPEGNFQHDITQYYLDFVMAMPHALNTALLGIYFRSLWEHFAPILLMLSVLFGTYIAINIKEKWDLAHPPKPFTPPTKMKQHLFFVVFSILGSCAPYLFAFLMLIPVVIALDLISTFELLGEERGRLEILKTKNELLSETPGASSTIRVALVGDDTPAAAIECNNDYCIVVTCDVKSKVSTVKIVKRSAVTLIGKPFTEAELAPKRK